MGSFNQEPTSIWAMFRLGSRCLINGQSEKNETLCGWGHELINL